MKKKISPRSVANIDDDIRAEYDFSGGVRGKYAHILKEEGYTIRVYRRDGTFTEKRVLGEKTITLEPDVQEYFPDSKAVNRALRTLISLIPNKRRVATKKAAGGRKTDSRKHLKT